ncbi:MULTISPECIES: RNA polymerase sigma factor [Chryseobacterium]|uniref:RNA polymerase sigma-70 factor (ECF subfamily) n=1 Tax=Chryseobacterium geocarposphaerae TaxID=1416776 RepID=A0ABU1LD55_9FLAO|nr:MULTISPECIES: sigma-70 family RNA polymerase sigma factor [Chryseobacterium]MDR6404475.1 RNA polymerase sigma-70 factor (ECF subfamily) [Chryseobacterium geocarposphaerae]MDR6698293.1 RNA polymerase sigma-70 factor (ECF subfamily) [Chryseobacterium ginsenosidimutans]
MHENALIPNLFRTEYRKIVSVLCSTFGIDHIEIAEDIVSDTFLTASETWSLNGIPENPTAWLYTVAKNKSKNYFKRDSLFHQKISTEIKYSSSGYEELEIDLSQKNITDSQLAMMFTICNPAISKNSQISLALNLLCGFGTQEIADAFLINKEVVYKRLQRAKEKLKTEGIKIEQPSISQISSNLETVLTALYLLFSEGYYSTSQNTILRQDFCQEAIRLTSILIENKTTNTPATNALLSLMYFHSSRFNARFNEKGESILYEEQDDKLWDYDLIEKGIYYLNQSASGNFLTKFHLEAAIAYWHTKKKDTDEKWENILQLYNQLLQIEYSPIAALNRTFAFAKVRGNAAAIVEAEKLKLLDNPFYYSLLGHLYTDIDNFKAKENFEKALKLSNSSSVSDTLRKYIKALAEKNM